MISPIRAPTASSRSDSPTRATNAGAAPVPRSPTKARPAVVDDVLAAERAGDRQVVRFCKMRDVTAGGVAPPAAADQHHRTLGRGEEAAQFGKIGGAGMRAHRTIGAGGRHRAAVAQHVLGQCQNNRSGPPGRRDLKRLVDQFGDALGHVDLRHPFGERCHHAAEIDLLKRLAVDLVARDLADQVRPSASNPETRCGCRSRRCTHPARA